MLGYLEGENLTLDWRFAEGRNERIPALAAELVATKPDVLITYTVAPTLALQKATRTIPIVFVVIGDPVGSGAVASLARPGGNTTGMALMTVDMLPKRVALLHEILPQARTIAILVAANSSNAGDQLRSTRVRPKRWD